MAGFLVRLGRRLRDVPVELPSDAIYSVEFNGRVSRRGLTLEQARRAAVMTAPGGTTKVLDADSTVVFEANFTPKAKP